MKRKAVEMKITKGIISREEAMKLAPDYVKSAEGDFDLLCNKIAPAANKMKKGQKGITYDNGKFVLVKITSVDHNSPKAIDGPLIRVGNGEYSWRVDSDQYVYPV